jgi:hypothetical protein
MPLLKFAGATAGHDVDAALILSEATVVIYFRRFRCSSSPVCPRLII